MHLPYIEGFPDGSFGPEMHVTREQVAVIITRAFGIEKSGTNTGFTDVARSRWSAAEIAAARKNEAINGYPDGSFGPSNPVTRAELAAILVRMAEKLGRGYVADEKIFSDVAGGKWYSEYISAASKMQLIEGYEDGTFKTGSPVTRAETVTMVNRLLGRDPETGQDLKTKENPFTDNLPTHWAYWQVLEASVGHMH
jgi:hypothetical protein